MSKLVTKANRPPVERTDIPSLREAMSTNGIAHLLREKHVPIHRHSVWYYLGGLTLMAYVVQVITGMLLLVYFEASSDVAAKSLEMIVTRVPYGWLVRSLHGWSASIAILLTVLHMFTSFFMKAYRPPREATWVTGVLLLAVMFGFGYTGYLLPDLHGVTLRQMYALHVAFLPLCSVLIVGGHLILTTVLGSSVPVGASVRRRVRFFPDYTLGELMLWLGTFGLLLITAWFFRWEFNGARFAPKDALRIGIQPDWYLAWLSEAERYLPDGFSLLVLILAFVALGAVPWLDRKSRANERSPLFTIAGAAIALILVLLTALAYFSV